MLFLVLFASFLQFSETNMNAPVEQPNAWSHPRDIIIKFPGSQFEPEQSVGFRVEQSGSVEFSKILSKYFYFCASREATVKVSNEVSDVESKHHVRWSLKSMEYETWSVKKCNALETA